MISTDLDNMMYAETSPSYSKQVFMPVKGDRLARRRQFLDLSQKDVAKAIGIKNYQQYADWENERAQPPVKYFVPLTSVLRTSIDYLFDLTDDPGDTFEEEGMSDEERKFILLKRAGQIKKLMELLLSDASLLPSNVPPNISSKPRLNNENDDSAAGSSAIPQGR